MKKAIVLLAMGFTLSFCNTPSETTTSGANTSGTNPNSTMGSDTTGRSVPDSVPPQR